MRINKIINLKLLLSSRQTDDTTVSIVTQSNDATNGLPKYKILHPNTADRSEECTARRIGVGYCSTTDAGGNTRVQLSLRRASSARFSYDSLLLKILESNIKCDSILM